jgi:glycosyltransferase involved in cell wall biosynthesis
MILPAIRLFADAHVFDKEYQGTRTFIKELYCSLADNPALEIFLGAYDTEKLRAVFPARQNVHFVKYQSRSGVKRLLYDIPTIITANKIDYAHFQYIIPPVKNCRFIVTIHDVLFNEFPNEFSFPYRFSKKLLFRRAASKADIITTVSPYSKQSIIKFLNAKPKNVHVIPNGVAERYFAEFDKIASRAHVEKHFGIKDFILYVSRFEKRKNHSSLVKAYVSSKLYESEIYLVMLGFKSIAVPELEQLLNNMPTEIRRFILIRDDVNDEELLEFYRSATLFVYPSKAEGFGISPLEAGALKIPVICSNAAAMNAFSFFGDNHIDPENEKLLAYKIRENIQTPPSPKDLENISRIIHDNYSWDNSSQKFYNLLVNHFEMSKKPARLQFTE